MQNILNKHPSILFSAHERLVEKRKDIYPCFLHAVYENNQSTYGFYAKEKKSKVIGSYFNAYKKLCRKSQ